MNYIIGRIKYGITHDNNADDVISTIKLGAFNPLKSLSRVLKPERRTIVEDLAKLPVDELVKEEQAAKFVEAAKKYPEILTHEKIRELRKFTDLSSDAAKELAGLERLYEMAGLTSHQLLTLLGSEPALKGKLVDYLKTSPYIMDIIHPGQAANILSNIDTNSFISIVKDISDDGARARFVANAAIANPQLVFDASASIKDFVDVNKVAKQLAASRNLAGVPVGYFDDIVEALRHMGASRQTIREIKDSRIALLQRSRTGLVGTWTDTSKSMVSEPNQNEINKMLVNNILAKGPNKTDIDQLARFADKEFLKSLDEAKLLKLRNAILGSNTPGARILLSRIENIFNTMVDIGEATNVAKNLANRRYVEGYLDRLYYAANAEDHIIQLKNEFVNVGARNQVSVLDLLIEQYPEKAVPLIFKHKPALLPKSAIDTNVLQSLVSMVDEFDNLQVIKFVDLLKESNNSPLLLPIKIDDIASESARNNLAKIIVQYYGDNSNKLLDDIKKLKTLPDKDEAVNKFIQLSERLYTDIAKANTDAARKSAGDIVRTAWRYGKWPATATVIWYAARGGSLPSIPTTGQKPGQSNIPVPSSDAGGASDAGGTSPYSPGGILNLGIGPSGALTDLTAIQKYLNKLEKEVKNPATDIKFDDLPYDKIFREVSKNTLDKWISDAENTKKTIGMIVGRVQEYKDGIIEKSRLAHDIIRYGANHPDEARRNEAINYGLGLLAECGMESIMVGAIESIKATGGVVTLENIIKALDTNDDKNLSAREIAAAYDRMRRELGLPEWRRNPDVMSWLNDLWEDLTLPQKVSLAIGVPLGLVGITSILLSGPSATNVIALLASLAAIFWPLYSAGELKQWVGAPVRRGPSVVPGVPSWLLLDKKELENIKTQIQTAEPENIAKDLNEKIQASPEEIDQLKEILRNVTSDEGISGFLYRTAGSIIEPEKMKMIETFRPWVDEFIKMDTNTVKQLLNKIGVVKPEEVQRWQIELQKLSPVQITILINNLRRKRLSNLMNELPTLKTMNQEQIRNWLGNMTRVQPLSPQAAGGSK